MVVANPATNFTKKEGHSAEMQKQTRQYSSVGETKKKHCLHTQMLAELSIYGLDRVDRMVNEMIEQREGTVHT